MNELSLMPERLENYRIINHLGKSDMAIKLGITPEKYSKIIHRKYDGSFTEYEHFAKMLYKESDKQYEFFTGKKLESPHTPDCATEIEMLSNTIKDLTKIISQLSHNLDELRVEIHDLKEGKESGAKIRAVERVPDH